MANQKATLHEIPLKTTELCLNKYEADIKPYQGFRKNNSPFFGDKLSPFNYRMVNATGDKYVGMDGTLYTLENGKLKVDGKTIIDYSSYGNAIVKNTYSSSGNVNYNYIVAFFDAEYALCAGSSNKLAVVDVTDGTIKLLIPNDIEYIPGEKCYFATSMYNFYAQRSAYCFQLSNLTVVIKADGSYWKSSNSHYLTDDSYTGGYCYKWPYNNLIVFGADMTYPKNIDISSTITATDISAINVYENGTLLTTITAANVIKATYVTNAGAIMYGPAGVSVSSSDPGFINTFTYGHVNGVSGGTVDTTVDNCYYYKGKTVAVMDNKVLYLIHTNNGIMKLRFTDITTANGSENYICIKPKTAHTVTQMPVGSVKDNNGNVYTTYGVASIGMQQASGEKIVYDLGNNIYSRTVPILENYSCANGLICPYVPVNTDRTYHGGFCFDSWDTMGNDPDAVTSYVIRLLYHDNTLQGISIAQDPLLMGTNLTATTSVDDFYPITMGDGNRVSFHDGTNWNVIKVTNISDLKFSVANERYLIVNTRAYLNCLDTQTGKMRHCATDWNDRAVFCYSYPLVAENITNWDTYLSKTKQIACVSSQNATERDSFVSTLYSPTAYQSKASVSNIYVPSGYTPDNEGVDLYFGVYDKTLGQPYIGSANAKNNMPLSLSTLQKFIKPYLSNTYYVYRDEILLSPSLFARYMYSYINSGMISDSGHTYVQDFANGIIPLLAMSFVSQLEGVSGMFTIQGMDYVITNGVISKYSAEEALSSCVSIGTMQLIGFTPLMAILWSDTNKTFYSFTGDRTLNPIMQADEIERVVSTSYNPNTMGIYLVTEDNIYIFTSEQLIRFELANIRDEDTRKKLETVDYAYPTEEGLALRAQDAIFFISYQKKDGYTSLPIKLTTSFYGRGSGVVSTNDTLYIRLFDEDKGEGKVLLKCTTLKEGSFSTEEKTFYVTKEKWDDDTSTLFLRYQPKWQEATGISFDIESPFAVATLSISEKPETVQNSKYNI